MLYNTNAHIVAAVQFVPVLRDPHANMATATQLAFEAAAKGARIIVLPELCMSGQRLQTPREAADCAQAVGGYQSDSLYDVAHKFDCYIVHGYVELYHTKFYNSAVVIGPTGVLGNARKRNLWGSDHMWAASGDDINPAPIVNTPMGRIGVLIGRDVTNASQQNTLSYKNNAFYRRGSVDTVCVMTDTQIEHGWPHAEWVDLAKSTRSNVIVSNSPGNNRGGSCVIDRTFHTWTYGTNFDDTAVVGGMIL